MFGDARETWYHHAPGSQDFPWAFACYSPPQQEFIGNPDLKVPDSARQTNTRRSGFIDCAFSILDVLGDYTRPPVPEIDGLTVYDLQPGFTSTALESDGYTQTTSVGGSSPLRSGVTADYLEDGSRIPALNFWFTHQKIGLADNVMKLGTKYRKLLDEICKTVGVWIIQSPFGQIDFQVARGLSDSAGGDFYASGVTVPTFRASTAGDEPNIDQDSGDRNAWKIKWKDNDEKAVKSCSVEWNTIVKPKVGLTVIESHKSPAYTGYGGYTASGEKEVELKVEAVTTNHDAIANQYVKTYGEPLTEVSFESALRFFSDDRDRTSGADCFLRMGRPINVQDTNHARGGDAVITAIRMDVCAGTMGLSAISGDSRAVDEHCWPESSSVDFGGTGVGNYTDKTITFTNDGADAINGTVTLVGSPGDFAINSGGTYTSLPPGNTHDVVIRFTPLESGVYAGKLELGGDVDAGTGCVNPGGAPYVLLVASAYELPICMSKGEIDFGQFYIGYAKDITFNVWNYGTGSLDGYVELPSQDDAAEFALVSGATEYNAPSTTDISLGGLTGGTAKEVKVRFRPSSATTFEARLNLNADVSCRCGDAIDTIVLKGEGIPLPDCFVTNQSMNFGTIKAGASSSDQMFTLSNTSNDTLSGTLEVNMNSDAPFAWAATPYDNEGNGSTVSANGTGTGGLTNYDWEMPRGGNTLNFYLKAAPGATAENRSWNGNVDPGGRDCAKIGLLVKVSAQDEGCTVSDLSLHFGGVEVNPGTPPTQTVTLTNPTNITIGGTCSVGSTKSGFSVTNGTPTGTSTATDNLDGTWDWQIKTTESIAWEITYDPSSAGVDSGAITWGEDETDSNCYTTGLIGQAYSLPFSAPSSVNLGNVPTNTTKTRLIPVSNHGVITGGDLEVTLSSGRTDWFATDPGGGYAAPGDTYTVSGFFSDGGGSHLIEVFWTPVAPGSLSATITVEDSATGSTQNITLGGGSYDPQGCFLSSDGSTLANQFNVGDVLVGSASATQNVKVYNNNTADIRLTVETAGTAGWTKGSVTDSASVTYSGGIYTVPTNGWVNVEMDLDNTVAAQRGVQVAKVNFGEQCQDSATLMGRVIAARDVFDINPSGLLFSLASDATQQLTATIYNTSDNLTLSTTASLAGGAASYFSFVSGGGAITVDPGEEHSITIECDPDGDTYIGWAFCDFSGDLDGIHIALGASITDATQAANLEVSNTLFAGILGAEDNVQDAIDTLDGHTVQDHSDGDTVLLKDGSVAMTGDMDFGGFDATNIAEISRTTGNIIIDMKTAATTRTLQIKNSGGAGAIANATVQDDLTVGGDLNVTAGTIDTNITASRVVVTNADKILDAAGCTSAELETLTDGSETTLHKHAYTFAIPFGQRNVDYGSDYWDWAGLVAGDSGYKAWTAPAGGSIVGISYTYNMSSVTTPGNYEFEVFLGSLGVGGAMVVESIKAISATGYVQGYAMYTPGTYTFTAGQMLVPYGRFAGGLTGAWRDGVAAIIVQIETA